jgi:mono/diheme cytochrome c family protein
VRAARSAIGGAIAAVLVVAGIGAFLWHGERQQRADPTDRTQVALGRQAYAAHCASCHGAALEGQPNWRQRLPNGRLPAPPHDVSGHTWHHPDRVLFEITKYGIAAHAPQGYESDMPGFGEKLSDDEIWAVIAYIKSEWPPEILTRQTEISQRAR